MTCPFLKEAQVRYCGTSAVRKLIPLAQADRTEEKCSSREHRACPHFQAQPETEAAGDAGLCPYLQASPMQYCAAAPVAKLVPSTESLLSRCGNDSHRYCELYQAIAGPSMEVADVDGLAMPVGLHYTANHMWLDVAEDGACHAGIDSFLSRLLGPVEGVTFMQTKGRSRPTAVVTAAGVDLQVVFPNPFLLTNCNFYLRADPARLSSEPYRAGWLFEGVLAPETLDHLLEGSEAREWMEQEQRSMTEFLQQEKPGQRRTMADGGLFAEALAHQLDREQLLVLFHEFFSPYASRKKA